MKWTLWLAVWMLLITVATTVGILAPTDTLTILHNWYTPLVRTTWSTKLAFWTTVMWRFVGAAIFLVTIFPTPWMLALASAFSIL
jgi:hypothetical protein